MITKKITIDKGWAWIWAQLLSFNADTARSCKGQKAAVGCAVATTTAVNGEVHERMTCSENPAVEVVGTCWIQTWQSCAQFAKSFTCACRGDTHECYTCHYGECFYVKVKDWSDRIVPSLNQANSSKTALNSFPNIWDDESPIERLFL